MGERQFGPYRLVQQIAVGGMAEIHLAKTHGIAGFEKYVALKMIHPNFSQDHQFIQMLIDEAKITVQLQHVNIAQTFDLGRVGDNFYITMEYVDGADLYKLLRKSSELDRLFPIPLSAFIAKEVASGLDYAHRKRDHNGRPLGIVHRDVSPQNVLISYSGEVKLVDFGIAKATMRARQTAAGVIKGKYYYMSPEQAWGEPLDHRTDVFSAGILLYETLTGQMLYLEEDLHKLLDMVRRAHIPPPSTLRSEIPPQLDSIVMHALAKEQEDRYQSAADLANDLERFLHSHAPVFSASKVAGWMYEVLGQAAAPTLLGLRQEKEPERDRGETRRLTRDQLVLARSEFTDENSIIFTYSGRESSSGGSADAMEETSTFDDPLAAAEQDEVDDVDSLPEAPRDQPARLSPSASASLPAPEPEPPAQADPAAESAHYVEPPTLRRLPGVTPGPALGRAARKDPSAPQIVPPPGQAAPRAPDQETRLLSERAPPPPRRSEPAAQAAAVESPAPRPEDEPLQDDATLISDAPNWWSGPGDHTEVADAPFGDQAFVPPPAAGDDHEAPTLLKMPAVKRPPGAWEPAPALVASVSQPAVSQLRPPRVSRRTPPGGVPAPHVAGRPGPKSGPQASVLASLLTPARGIPEVVLSPPTPLTEPARQARQSGSFAQQTFGPPASEPAFSTRAMNAALERDEIPDQYKIRSRSQPTPWLIGLLALILSASVATVLLAIYGTGSSDDSAPGDAVLQIISIPAGATVTVDGRVLPDRTPTTIRGAHGTRFLFGFELPRYQREEEEFVVPDTGDEHQVVARLEPMVVKLTVESVPTGAEVFIGGNSVGRTPLVLPGLDPQSTRSIELRLKGYRPVRQLLDWSKQSDQQLLIPLSP